MDKFYTKATIEKADSGDFTAIASTATEDRHGEIVSVEGWDLKAFKKNPVLLWAHDHNEPAIGTASKVWIDGAGKSAKLMIKGKLHDYTEKAKAIKQMVEDGIIKTMSVGFRPIDMEENVFQKQELLEVSFVNVPANSQAMVLAYKSLKEAGFKNKVINELGIPVAVLEELDTIKKDIEKLQRAKEEINSASEGRHPSKRAVKSQVYVKAIERATTKLSQQRRSKEVLVIKQAVDKLAQMNKEEINGQNKRTA